MSQAALLPAIAVRTAIGTDGASFERARPSATPARSPGFRKRPDLPDTEILDIRTAPYALWVLRLTVGAVFLQHVMRMVFGYEPADPSQLFALPPGVSPFALAWDTAIGLALVYGLWPRVAAIAGAATLTMALIAAHGATALSSYGWQNPALWTAALLALALAGDGAFAVVPSRLRSSGLAFRREHRA